MRTYVVVACGTWMVKIGRSNNVRSRLGSMASGCPFRLHVLHALPGDHEAWLHEDLAKYRSRLEWFDMQTTEARRALNDAVAGVLYPDGSIPCIAQMVFYDFFHWKSHEWCEDGDCPDPIRAFTDATIERPERTE